MYGPNPLYTKGQNSLTDGSAMVFADGDQDELASVTGDPLTGYTATRTIGL